MNIHGVIFDLKKYAIHDGPGIRTTLFFKGCPLNCRWCHNPESRCSNFEINHSTSAKKDSGSISSGFDKAVGCIVTIDAVMKEFMKDEIFYDQSGGGVTFSGGEPMMQAEFLSVLLEKCRNLGIHTAVDTSGYAPIEDYQRIYNLVDLFLYDLKIIDDDSHIKYTGVSNKLIHSNLAELASAGDKAIIRIPLIPEITDTDENLEATVNFLRPFDSIRHICLLPYNAFGEDKIKRYSLDDRPYHWQTYDDETISLIKDKLSSSGYNVTIGN